MSDRQAGWYWATHEAFDDPQVVQYCPSDGFMIAGIGGAFDEDAFESIGPRIPTAGEPWQTVPVEPSHESVKAGNDAMDSGCEVEGIYKDMLAAAPSPDGHSA